LDGCSPAPTPAEKSAEGGEEHVEEHHVQLPTMRTRREIVPQTIEFPGKVSALPDHSVSVSPFINGKIIEVSVIPGQRVAKGQLIAILDSQQLRAQLQQATAPQVAAVNAVTQAKITLDLARKNLERSEALFGKDIMAAKDVIAARSQAELAKAQVEAAQAKVEEAKLAPAHIATQVAFSKVYSPISGVVAQRFLNVGSAADPNTPIAHIVNLDSVMVHASMPADSPADPRVGHHADITTVAEPGVIYRGEIKSVSPIVDVNNNTVSIELLAVNHHGRLKEGQQVTVSISTSKKSAVLIPETAIVPGPDDPAEHFIYVVKDNKLSMKKIFVGKEQNGLIPVFEGLSGGEEIVTSGGYGVPEESILDRKDAAK
jgi:RND family efflux transporter MFP subunit